MIRRSKEKTFNQNGLTIIELVISLFVVGVGIIGIFSAISLISILASNIEDRLIAAYLAQEGVEIIRNIRDSNWKKIATGQEALDWSYKLFPECEYGCMVDYTTNGDSSPILSWQENRYLAIDNNNFYSYQEGKKTKFKRKITIKKISPSSNLPQDIMKVTVEIYWDQKPNILNPLGLPGELKVENTLYNWY